MKRQNNVIAWLTLLILLNIASSSVIYWQQARIVKALSLHAQSGEVEKYLLECRRQEKNFFIRTSMEAIQMYMANHESATILISSLMNKKLPIDIGMDYSTLNEMMENYREAFKAHAAYQRNNPTRNENISTMHLCIEIARKCHSQMASIVAETEQRYQTVSREAGMITQILLVSISIVSILIAVFIVKQVAVH
ncbi:hypothetical protein ACFL6E_00730 [Candidatus Neomarinimicrobiota bacterium]